MRADLSGTRNLWSIARAFLKTRYPRKITGPPYLPELMCLVEFSYRQKFTAITVVGFILVVIQVYNCARQILFGPSRQYPQRLLGGRKVVEIDCLLLEDDFLGKAHAWKFLILGIGVHIKD